ncbi:MAG: diacylglycerol kinase family protein [Myxococcota bacterium]
MTIALVTNPRSRRNRRDPDLSDALAASLGDAGALCSPDDLEALAASAAGWAADPPALLAINGGDGTLHQVLTAAIRAAGEERPLPPVAILRGGTMNIVADSVGVRIGPQAMLAHVTGDAPLPRTTRRILRIQADDAEPVYGFLSGNGVISRFLELYYAADDPSPADAARLLARGALSALVQGPLIRQLMRPYAGRVLVDGQPVVGAGGETGRWTAVALGTVEQMGLGFRVFPMTRQAPDRIGVVAIGSSVAQLALELPRVYLGRGVRREGNSVHLAGEVVLDGDEPIALMVDGDLCRAERRVRIGVGPAVTFLLPPG